MREAKSLDNWRHINEVKKFKTRINNIKIEGLNGFDNIEIEPKSAITAFCGKNGVGKTTLLKFIYNALKGSDNLPSKERYGDYDFFIDLVYDKTTYNIDKNNTNEFEKAFYLEPSKECSRILEYLKTTTNIDELIDGEGENITFNDLRVKPQIEKIIGKQYKRIIFKEIADAIEPDYIFPYFEVETMNGIIYSNTDMGMGEFSVLYILWFIHSCDRDSFVFIEEPENFISANTQEYLMDKIAEQCDKKNIWITLSTHSEHILSKIDIEHTKVLQKKPSEVTHLIEPKYREKYLAALGLTPQLDGIIFVEDEFAANFINFILSTKAPSFLKTHKIIPLRCDSNIEKIILHYQPLKKSPVNYIGVFDADQKNKIGDLTSKDIYVVALPAESAQPPEEIVWITLLECVNEISQHLDLDNDSFQTSIMDHGTKNYHDRYKHIANDMQTPLNVLLRTIFSFWQKNTNNKKIIDMFLFSILNYNRILSSEIKEMDDDYIYIHVFDNEFPIKKTDILESDKINLIKGVKITFKLYFDSENFIIRLSPTTQNG